MTFGRNTIGRFLRGFRKGEDGGPTIEFVLVFAPFMLLMVSAFELGLLTTRHVMLERGVDMAVREVRLNTGAQITEAQFKSMVCNAAGIIPNCTTNLRIEMIAVDLRITNGFSSANVERNAPCLDVADPYQEAPEFVNGLSNEMMLVRACARLVPMLPDTGLGWFLSRMDAGYYRLVSTTAFAMEPI